MYSVFHTGQTLKVLCKITKEFWRYMRVDQVAFGATNLFRLSRQKSIAPYQTLYYRSYLVVILF